MNVFVSSPSDRSVTVTVVWSSVGKIARPERTKAKKRVPSSLPSSPTANDGGVDDQSVWPKSMVVFEATKSSSRKPVRTDTSTLLSTEIRSSKKSLR